MSLIVAINHGDTQAVVRWGEWDGAPAVMLTTVFLHAMMGMGYEKGTVLDAMEYVLEEQGGVDRMKDRSIPE